MAHKNSELFEIIAGWQETGLPVTLVAIDGNFPSPQHPEEPGQPYVKAGIALDGATIFEGTVPGTDTANQWLKQVASAMGLPEPTYGGRRNPAEAGKYAGWREKGMMGAQVKLLERGVSPVAMFKATQYPHAVGIPAIKKMSLWEVTTLIESDLASEHKSIYYVALAQRAMELGLVPDSDRNITLSVRSRHPAVRVTTIMKVATKEQAIRGLQDPDTEVVRAAIVRLGELGGQKEVDSFALDESRSSWERIPAIARATPSVVEPLLRHKDEVIRCWTLGRIGRLAYASLLKDPSEKVRCDLQQALIQEPIDQEINDMLISLAEHRPVDDAAKQAAEVLAKRGFTVKPVEKYLNTYAKQSTLVGYQIIGRPTRQ